MSGAAEGETESLEQKLALRIKSKKSQNAVLRDISTKGTVNDLLIRISELTGIPNENIVLLTGFPPRRVEFIRSALLETLGLSNQDTLIVEAEQGGVISHESVQPATLPVQNLSSGTWKLEDSKYTQAGHKPWDDTADYRVDPPKPRILTETAKTVELDAEPSTSEGPKKNQLIINALNSSIMNESNTSGSAGASKRTPESKTPSEAYPGSELLHSLISAPPGPGHTSNPITLDSPASLNGMILRHVVPADNSCLFTSVSFCLSGNMDEHDNSSAVHMRELIAATVASDPDRFNEAILGRTNSDYVNWIMKNESWGGGIELSILSDFYGHEISVVDIQSLHISKFGEDKNYPQRMLLLYDGIHYDPLYMDPFDGSRIQTLFPTSEESILEKAKQLGREAKAAHQFTDLSNFALRCGICNTLIKGQTEAQAHAKTTGHTNFAEIISKPS